MTVDQYIHELGAVPKAHITELRTLIKKTVPHAEECISYGMPAYKLLGMVAYICSHAHHTGLYVNPAVLDSFREQLSPKFKLAKATVQIPFGTQFPKRIIAQMLKLAVIRNKEKAKRKKGS